MGSPFEMARRSRIHQPPKVPLSPSEAEQAKLLSRWATRLAVRQDAAALLVDGADPDALADLRISTTTSLHGAEVAMQRWGASSAEACRLAQRRVRARGLIDGALYLTVLYCTHKDAPPPLYLGCSSGLSGDGEGLAWSPGSQVDPTILVKRFPEPKQEELWDADDVPWTYWSSVRDLV